MPRQFVSTIASSLLFTIPQIAHSAAMRCEQIVNEQYRENVAITADIERDGEAVISFTSKLKQKGKSPVLLFSKILYQHSFSVLDNGPRISVVVASGGAYDAPPTTFYINWAQPKLTQVGADGFGNFTTVDQWACNRLD